LYHATDKTEIPQSADATIVQKLPYHLPLLSAAWMPFCKAVHNSLAIRMPSMVTEQIALQQGTEIEMSVGERAITLIPLRKKPHQKIAMQK
jgi:hypothetical protein